MELGYHLSAHQCQRDLDLPLVVYRRVEPHGRGLGCCGAEDPVNCSRSGLPGLPAQVDKQGPPAAASSPCRPATTSRRPLEELRAATLEVRLEGLGVLRSFSRHRVSNDKPYSELFRTAKNRPVYPNNPFNSKDHAGQWVAAFVNSYNHRHSGIIFVTPQQRH